MTNRIRLVFSLLLMACLPLSVLAEADKWQSPETVDGAITTSLQQARELHAKGTRFIDVRSQRQYRKRHIPGAINLYIKGAFTEGNLLKLLGNHQQPFVVYCNGIHCSLSSKAATRAVEWGFRNVHYFREGARGWRLDGNPLEQGEPAASG
jgi:rhodanese-related sulfurtransferase